jgi:CheY-like chemotaxis protein
LAQAQREREDADLVARYNADAATRCCADMEKLRARVAELERPKTVTREEVEKALRAFWDQKIWRANGGMEAIIAALSTLGIDTHPFPTGQDALDALRANPTTYNAAIIDQNMPGMTGLQTLAALRRLQPELPIILTSGYPLSLLPNPLPQATFLHKPYTMTQLHQALTKAINLHAPTA